MSEILLRVGHVVLHEGKEWVVDLVNDCRARIKPLGKQTKVITNRLTEESKEVSFRAGPASIANTLDSDYVLRRLSGKELFDVLPKRSEAVKFETKQPAQETTETKTKDDSMANKSNLKKERKPLAGRAEAVHALKAKGVKKNDAFETIWAKFDCSKAAFDKIWDAKPRGASETKKPAKAAKAPPSKKAPKAKAGKAPTAPPAPKAPPAPPAPPAPAPAAPPAPAAAAA